MDFSKAYSDTRHKTFNIYLFKKSHRETHWSGLLFIILTSMRKPLYPNQLCLDMTTHFGHTHKHLSRCFDSVKNYKTSGNCECRKSCRDRELLLFQICPHSRTRHGLRIMLVVIVSNVRWYYLTVRRCMCFVWRRDW